MEATKIPSIGQRKVHDTRCIIMIFNPINQSVNRLLIRGSIIGGRTFRKPPYFVPSKLQTAFVF